MNDKTQETGQNIASGADSGDIMQHIQDMIGNLLQNAVSKIHSTDTSDKLGGEHPPPDGSNEIAPQMGIAEIKSFLDVMRKFIDNVQVMVDQLEGHPNQAGTDDMFLDGYMATADHVLEIAAFSMKDNLTGLSNRYGFDNRLILEWNRATRDKNTLSMVIFSADCFYDSNDSLNDEILLTVSNKLDTIIKRTTDFIARWSDDEFAVILPITDKSGATIVAERIREEIGIIDTSGITGKSGKPLVSIGVCSHSPEPAEKPVDFINKAYDAYEKAKETPGDSIVFA